MTEVVHTEPGAVPHAPAPPRRGSEHLTKPGFVRAAWMTPLFFLIGAGSSASSAGSAVTTRPGTGSISVVAFMTTAPIGFLAGIGSFDYWLYYISGKPTREDHSGHGAYSWRDYFKVNTDHKVIGVQYLATTFFFFVVGGLFAMVFRAELANPDMQYVDTQTFNGLVSEHAALMIFLFIIPAFAASRTSPCRSCSAPRTWRSRA